MGSSSRKRPGSECSSCCQGSANEPQAYAGSDAREHQSAELALLYKISINALTNQLWSETCNQDSSSQSTLLRFIHDDAGVNERLAMNIAGSDLSEMSTKIDALAEKTGINTEEEKCYGKVESLYLTVEHKGEREK